MGGDMTFDDAVAYLANAPYTGGAGDKFVIFLDVIATQGLGSTLSGGAELALSASVGAPLSEIEGTTALISGGMKGPQLLSSRVFPVIIPAEAGYGSPTEQRFDQPFFAGDVGLGAPMLSIVLSRPWGTAALIKRKFWPDAAAFSAGSNTGVVADFEVTPLEDFYPGLRQFSIRLHDLGAVYAGIGPAPDDPAVAILYTMTLNGELEPG
jgi:hypothetical protein